MGRGGPGERGDLPNDGMVGIRIGGIRGGPIVGALGGGIRGGPIVGPLGGGIQ